MISLLSTAGSRPAQVISLLRVTPANSFKVEVRGDQ